MADGGRKLVIKMNNKVVKLVVPFLILVVVISIMGVGCEEKGVEAPAPAPSPAELSSTFVPNTPLDVYFYARQDIPTVIPAKMTNLPYDIEVESLAIWGVPAGDEFALGIGLNLTSAEIASRVYADVKLEEGSWKRLSGNIIYLVQGSGTAAESLKTAISNNDFKRYDDGEGLEAAATLSGCATAKPAAIGLAKPSKALISFIAKDVSASNLGQINMILSLVNIKVIAIGLYSPQHIDIARIAEVMQGGGSITDLDLGLLALVKSGLPGLLVEPALKKLLTESGFAETSLGGFTLYKGSQNISGQTVPVLVRIEGSRVFGAVSGQESYAGSLITCVK